MIEIFESVLNLTLTGSVVILLIIATRFLLRKIPTKYIYGLWAVAAFKLLCPKSPSSVMSVFNYLPRKKITVAPTAVTKISVPAQAVRRTVGSVARPAVTSAASSPRAATESSVGIWHVLMIVWIAGMLLLTIGVIYKTVKIYMSLRNTKRIQGNVYTGPSVSSPFVFGILSPRIYMPEGLSDKEFQYLLCHEKTHIRRKDMIFKAIGISTLIVHWFNPLVWIAFRLFERDMEMSCDEEVIKNIDNSLRADYCMSLVTYARKSTVPKYLVVPISFGKKDVKVRINNIMKYRKMTKLLSAASLALVAVIATGCFFSANDKKVEIAKEDKVQSAELKNLSYTPDESEEDVVDETESEETEAFTEEDDYYVYGDDEWTPPEIYYENPEALPINSLPDGALFDLDIPLPDGATILIDKEIANGTEITESIMDEAGCTEYYWFANEGETAVADFEIIITDPLSDEQFTDYVDALRDFGIKDDWYSSAFYFGYTEDGLYIIIDLAPEFTVIRVAGSTDIESNTFMYCG